ncbi:MAG: ABC transporter permease [Candidatus Hydrogenedentes bacterium]|nr:ABC transporter permease [Candidatus Hydrogenedentota bacterium]
MSTPTRIPCPPQLDKESGRTLYQTVRTGKLAGGQKLVLDFVDTTAMDSLGGAWLVEIADHARRRNTELLCENHTGHVSEFIDMIEPALLTAPPLPARTMGIVESLGNTTLSATTEGRQFLELCIDAIYWTLIAPLEGKGLRWGLLLDEIHEMGVRAVRIVCLMNFLLGLIIAMLMAKQAENYGISLFVADILVIGFNRELAAIMTAVVVSARTGAAIAAEISTMKVQEEIDALKGMGLNVAQFLVAPKLLAMLIVLPCLVTLGTISGVLGGAVWGIAVLGFQPAIWFNQTINACHFDDIFQGMLKTFFFAVIIALIGCHNGLRVTGGSRGVGLMTTRSVVQDIFMIIVIDIIFAMIFYYVLQ